MYGHLRSRIFADVRQRFLHHVVDGHACPIFQHVGTRISDDLPCDDGVGCHGTCLCDQCVDIGVVGMGRSAEYAKKSGHVMQRMLGFMSDRLHGGTCHDGIVRAGVPATVGLHDDDRQRMRHHVMHVPRDACTLRQRRDIAILDLARGNRVIAFLHHPYRHQTGTLPVGDDDRRRQAQRDGDEHHDHVLQYRIGAVVRQSPTGIDGVAGGETIQHRCVDGGELSGAHGQDRTDRHRPAHDD